MHRDDTNERRQALSGPLARRWMRSGVRMVGLLTATATLVAVVAPGTGGADAADAAAAPESTSAVESSDPPLSVSRWPNGSNTGVPEGTELEIYAGPMTITVDNTALDAVIVNGNLRIMADNVSISRSIINGRVQVRDPEDGSFSIVDSEIRIQHHLGTGLDRYNFVANRVEISGGRRSVYCRANCTIENSWVHGQAFDPNGQSHMSGIRMGQDTIVRHNTITCDGARVPPASGCSAGLTGYGDFAPVRDNTIEGNLFLGGTSTMCAYGGSSEGKPFADEAGNIRFIDNVFVRGSSGSCGIRRPIAGFDVDAPGNVWRNNRWDDGSLLLP